MTIQEPSKSMYIDKQKETATIVLFNGRYDNV